MTISRITVLVCVVVVLFSTSTLAQRAAVLVVAGDIASGDDLAGAEATTKLIENIQR